MKSKIAVLLLFFALVFSLSSVPGKANAIPAFSQKYHFSCSVCHTVFPNLNPFGRAFWRNGYRLPATNGMPADATKVADGLTIPNPFPVPIMLEAFAGYSHTVQNGSSQQQNDKFNSAKVLLAYGGNFPISVPLANSISFYVLSAPNQASMLDANISVNGIGWGYGVPSHLINAKVGDLAPAGAYFDRFMGIYMLEGPQDNLQSLSVGADGVAATLAGQTTNNMSGCVGCHSVGGLGNGGFELYGTPGYHLWYKAMVSKLGSSSNTTEYSYQLKEYMPVLSGHQLEFGYYGGIAAGQQLASSTTIAAGSTNTSIVNGLDLDFSNSIYEIGATYMVQMDSNPYGNSGVTLPNGSVQKTNGYGQFEAYGRYLFPQIGYGLMLSADYAQYNWRNKDAQAAYNLATSASGSTASCPAGGVYDNPSGNYNLYAPADGSCTGVEGVQHALTLQAEYNLAYNAHLWVDYIFTNAFQYNTFGAGIDIAI